MRYEIFGSIIWISLKNKRERWKFCYSFVFSEKSLIVLRIFLQIILHTCMFLKPEFLRKYTLWVIIFIIILLCGGYYFSSHQKPYVRISTYVDGHSMEPSLVNGEKICLFRQYYTSAGDIPSGQIIGVHFNGKNMNVVKRVIGIPGDRITFGKDGYIYRNGKNTPRIRSIFRS